ncbi:MAG: hypothetical protein Kow0092_07010 [Deferrisomatales bacterium]
MNKHIAGAAAALFVLALALPSFAGGSGEHGHGESEYHEMDHDDHLGYEIEESGVEGYTLAYHLVDMAERMEAMKGMKGMSMKGMDPARMKSHHLMLYIMGPDGKMVTDAKVGYKLRGPDGTEQKAMAMAMKGGYGADVDLAAKGAYEIKTKVVTGEHKLLDVFTYTVK